MRQITSRAVLKAIFDQAPISRADLARLIGLSKQSMSEIVRDLEEDGWIRVTGRTQGLVGRSAVTYEVEPTKAYVFGADVGGTKIHAAIADVGGTIIEEVIELTDRRGGEHIVDQMVRISTTLAQKVGIGTDRIKSGGIGIPGAVHPRTRRLSMVPNIPGLTELDFEPHLKEKLGYPVFLDNDVNVAARGEQWRGKGRDIDNFVFVAVGTGIGMGIITEGRLLRGARGGAGEISTLPIGADPFDSRTFASGALESAIGSEAIRKRYEGLGGTPGLSVKELFERQSDPLVTTVIDEIARVIAVALTAVCAVVDPEAIIFGGSVGARVELVDRIRFYLARCNPASPPCSVSALGSQAGLLGAIGIALDRFRDALFEIPTRGEPQAGLLERSA
jgi:predicted NBD/HSP70 family sugar kinase